MSEPPFSDPHDRFFRISFSQIEVPRSLIAGHLPAEVVACLDLGSLRIVDGSFVDEELRRSQSDLLFECDLKQGEDDGGDERDRPTALVYVLVEHKSYADPQTPFQLLKYVVRILERRQREGLPLCCVIPMVVYHGEGPWNAARSLDDLIDVPASLKVFVPRFEMPLLDLGQLPDERLVGDAFSRGSLLLLKYGRRPDLIGVLRSILESLRGEPIEAAAEMRLTAMLVYMVNVSPQLDPEQLRELVESTFPDQGDTLMETIAERWMKQGLEQGLEQGLAKGREEGREVGREEGRLIGTINTCLEILGDTAAEDSLGGKSLEELQALAETVQRQVRERLAGNPPPSES